MLTTPERQRLARASIAATHPEVLKEWDEALDRAAKAEATVARQIDLIAEYSKNVERLRQDWAIERKHAEEYAACSLQWHESAEKAEALMADVSQLARLKVEKAEAALRRVREILTHELTGLHMPEDKIKAKALRQIDQALGEPEGAKAK